MTLWWHMVGCWGLWGEHPPSHLPREAPSLLQGQLILENRVGSNVPKVMTRETTPQCDSQAGSRELAGPENAPEPDIWHLEVTGTQAWSSQGCPMGPRCQVTAANRSQPSM